MRRSLHCLYALLFFASPAHAQPQKPQAPASYEGRIVTRISYQRTETLNYPKGQKDANGNPATANLRSSLNISVFARSETDCTWQTDEWGGVLIFPDKTKKPQGNGSYSYRSRSKSWDKDSSSLDTDTRSGEFQFGDGNILGVGEIINAEAAPGEYGARFIASFHAKGTAHSETHGKDFNQSYDKPVDTSGGTSLVVYPMRSKGKVPDASEYWYGATTQKMSRGGLSVSFGGSRSSKLNDTKITETLSGNVELLPGKPIPADMTIVPADQNAYDNWIPLPTSDDATVTKLFGSAQPLVFTVAIKPKDPSQPAPMGTIDLRLENVSKHLGYCGNYPHKADTQDGLAFVAGGDVTIDSNDPKHAYSKPGASTATVWVKSNECGGYGRLTARCPELGIDAVDPQSHNTWLNIPRDDNNNHVADAWEKTNGVYGKNYPADWDEETSPTGKTKGDGYTLYEEYRGFVVKDAITNDQAFQRLTPKQKKLFIYPTGDDAAIYTSAAKTYAIATGIQPVFIPTINQLMDDNGDPVYPTWVNFNSNTDDGIDFGPKQHAVLIRNSRRGSGSAEGTWGITQPKSGGGDGPFTPNDIRYVALFRDEIRFTIYRQIDLYSRVTATSAPHSWKWMNDHNVTPAQFAAILKDGTAISHLTDKAIGFAVIHEMGHATGAEHHGIAQMDADSAANGGSLPDGKSANDYYASGDATCPMFYWANGDMNYYVPFALGSWDPSLTALRVSTSAKGMGSATAWRFCTTDTDKISLHDGN